MLACLEGHPVPLSAFERRTPSGLDALSHRTRRKTVGRPGCVHTSGVWVTDATIQNVVPFPLLCYHMVLNCKQPVLVACCPHKGAGGH